jgi:hypothetical protein
MQVQGEDSARIWASLLPLLHTLVEERAGERRFFFFGDSSWKAKSGEDTA